LLLAPAIILQQNLLVKVSQTVLFLVLAVLTVSTGKTRLVVGSCIFMIATIIVNLFSPVGRLILRVGPLRITLGALHVGIFKAATLASLLYISRICVRPSVRLPGVLGLYISQALAYLNKLLAGRQRLVQRKLIQRLDEQFEILFDEVEPYNEHPPPTRNTADGLLFMAVLLIVNWGAVFFPISALLGEG
jgi:hypothetical protein